MLTSHLPPDERSLHAESSQQDPPVPWNDFRVLVEASGDLLTLIDREGRILYDNPAVERVLGYAQGELVGRSAFELIHPADLSAAVWLLAELATGTRSAGALVFRFRRRDGAWCSLESRGRVISSIRGEPRIVVTSRETGPENAAGSASPVRPPPEAELEASRVEVVERLARAAEFRDDETGRHLRRVGALSAALARRLRLDATQVEIVRRAAPLHDVGKIGIPDAILLKAGPLSPEEEKVMRTHPVLGARILEGGLSALVRAAETIALCHHERWDGQGYPEGLREEKIPLTARIVSLVDFFDALTHDRPYRRAWDRGAVIDLVRSESERRFDPEVVRAFLELVTGERHGPF